MGWFKSRKFEAYKEIACITQEEKIDLYSFAVSLVLHVIILLSMAIFSIPKESAPMRIEISWSDADEADLQEEVFTAINIELPIENHESINELEYTISEFEENKEFDLIEPENNNQTYTELFSNTEEISKQLITNENSDNHAISDNEQISSIINSLADSVGEGVRANSRGRGRDQSGEIGKRLALAGAKTGDVQISIAWNSTDDIDLHVSFSPGNGLVDNINWTNRFGQITGGMLDIDMNANNYFLSPRPVENIFWPPNSSPTGIFDVYIHFYRSWTGNSKVPVTIIIKSMDKVSTHQAIAVLGMRPQHITRFSTIQKKPKF
jgi:hypothetical protein